MRTIRQFLVGPLVLLTALSSPAFAQDRGAADPTALANAVAKHVAQQDADRAAIHEALSRPEVRDVAAKAGIDLDRAATIADTLGGDALVQAAGIARQVNDSLVGGASTIVISTTTIIILLLLVLLLVVAIK